MDLAVTSGLRADMLNKTLDDGSASVKAYEHHKRSYMDTESICREEGINFIPLICEADGGAWGPAANGVWNEIAKHKSVLTGETVSTTATYLLQSLGLILHRENARAILRRSITCDSDEYNELLGALVACGSSQDL